MDVVLLDCFLLDGFLLDDILHGCVDAMAHGGMNGVP
jgi:hypothetical protein